MEEPLFSSIFCNILIWVYKICIEFESPLGVWNDPAKSPYHSVNANLFIHRIIVVVPNEKLNKSINLIVH
jgi:hypothetical protein